LEFVFVTFIESSLTGIIASQGIKKVVADMGENNVVQVITDNGSNYKKACHYLTNEYLHIA
jgi:hypothetical protein